MPATNTVEQLQRENRQLRYLLAAVVHHSCKGEARIPEIYIHYKMNVTTSYNQEDHVWELRTK